MTNKTEMVLVPRELAQELDDLLYILTGHDSHPKMIRKYGEEFWVALDKLRNPLCKALAAPPEDVRAVVDEPVLWFKQLPGMLAKSNGQTYDVMFSDVPGYEPLYRRPRHQMGFPERESLRDAIAEAIGGDTYDCIRVWQAWGAGTMSEDDFVPIIDQEERLSEIVDACLYRIAELNK